MAMNVPMYIVFTETLTSPVSKLERRKTASPFLLIASRRGGQARSGWPGGMR